MKEDGNKSALLTFQPYVKANITGCIIRLID